MLTKSFPFTLLILVGLFAGVFACQNGTSTAQSDATHSTVYEDIDAATFAAKLQAGEDVVLLDVRTPKEIAAGKIVGAIEMDYNGDQFAEQLAALDKDKTYLVYCASGNRSGKTCKLMQDQGFRECYNLIGGYGAWAE